MKVFDAQVKCPRCGNVQTIIRSKSLRKRKNHVKDLWCPFCKEVTKHLEKGDE